MMVQFRALPLLGFLVLSVVSHAQAEIYQCDGKWTNLPCDGAVERTIPESIPADASLEEQVSPPAEPPGKTVTSDGGDVLEPLAPRYSIVRKLRKFNREFFLKHKITLTKDQLHAYEERCMNRQTPMQECQNEYDALVQRLNAQVKKP